MANVPAATALPGGAIGTDIELIARNGAVDVAILAGQIAKPGDLILAPEIQDQGMGQGRRVLEPFGMPEGGRLAVKGIRHRAIFPNELLAVDRYDSELLLRNETRRWRPPAPAPHGLAQAFTSG